MQLSPWYHQALITWRWMRYFFFTRSRPCGVKTDNGETWVIRQRAKFKTKGLLCNDPQKDPDTTVLYYHNNNPGPLSFYFRTWHETNNMELVVSKWERVCRSLQIYVALKCRQPWQEIRDGKRASLSSFSPNQWRKWIWMPSGVRGRKFRGWWGP